MYNKKTLSALRLFEFLNSLLKVLIFSLFTTTKSKLNLQQKSCKHATKGTNAKKVLILF